VGASLVNNKTKLQLDSVIRPLVDLEDYKLKISLLGQHNHNLYSEEELTALQASEELLNSIHHRNPDKGFSGKLNPLRALSASHSHSNLEQVQFLVSSNLPQEETNYLEEVIREADFKTSHLLHPGSHNYQYQSSVKPRLMCKQRPSARHNKTIRGFLDSQAHSGFSNSKHSHSSSFKGSLHSLGVSRSHHLDSLEQPSPAAFLVNLNNNSNNPRCSKLNHNLASLAWFHSHHKDLLASPNLHLLLHLEECNQEGSLGIKWAKTLNHKVSLLLHL
jgi:hypothetical protein